MTRKKWYLSYSVGEEKIIISLINDYKPFIATDADMMLYISAKTGRYISQSLFRRLKKTSRKKGQVAEESLNP